MQELLSNFSEIGLEQQLDVIARIAYLESNQTQIARGGGSLPEIIVEGLLLSMGGQFSYLQSH